MKRFVMKPSNPNPNSSRAGKITEELQEHAVHQIKPLWNKGHLTRQSTTDFLQQLFLKIRDPFVVRVKIGKTHLL